MHKNLNCVFQLIPKNLERTNVGSLLRDRDVLDRQSISNKTTDGIHIYMVINFECSSPSEVNY